MAEQTQEAWSLVEKVNDLLQAGEPGNISEDTYGGYTGYDPQAIKDAMNTVFGLGKWGFQELSSEITTDEKGAAILIIAKVEVWIAGVEWHPASWGQNRITKGDVGDARKGAATDAMKKALSNFSVGNRAYLGLLPTKKERQNNQRATPMTTTGAPISNHQQVQNSRPQAQQTPATTQQSSNASASANAAVASSGESVAAPKTSVVPSVIDKARTDWAMAYGIPDVQIDARWPRFVAHVLGNQIADPNLTQEQLNKLRANIAQRKNLAAQTQSQPAQAS